MVAVAKRAARHAMGKEEKLEIVGALSGRIVIQPPSPVVITPTQTPPATPALPATAP